MDAGGALLSASTLGDDAAIVGRAMPPLFFDGPLEALRSERSCRPPRATARDCPGRGADRRRRHHPAWRAGPRRRRCRRAPGVLFLNGSGPVTRWGTAPDTRLKTLETREMLAGRGFVSLVIDARGAGDTGFGKADRPLSETRVADSARSLALACVVAAATAGRSSSSATASARLSPCWRCATERQVRRRDWCFGASGPAAQGHPDGAGRTREPPAGHVGGRELPARAIAGPMAGKGKPQRSRGVASGRIAAAYRPGDPRQRSLATVAVVRSPLLIVHGDKDIQTSLDADARALYAAALRAGVDATLLEIPDADHLFRLEQGASTPERYAATCRPIRNISRPSPTGCSPAPRRRDAAMRSRPCSTAARRLPGYAS